MMALGMLLWASPAAAGWSYSQACGAESKTRSFDLLQSQAYLMLDESGSMGWDGKWSAATSAIRSAVSSKTSSSSKDVVQFGLGTFDSGRRNHVSPRENAYGPIDSALRYSASPGGGTYMGNAIDISRQTLLNEPSASKRPQATIFITDGYPSDDQRNIVSEVCDHRNQAGPVYTVGFGSGTDEEFNNLMAAAGGTGYCCKDGNNCTTNTTNHVDPCSSNHTPFTNCNWWGCSIKSNWECHGAAQVSGGTGLKSVISGITNDLACRVDIDNIWDKKYSDNAYGCSADNYNCLDLSFGTKDVSYNPSNPNGDGWRWLDDDTQNTVILNENTCNEIEKSYTSNSVTVDRACMCGDQTPGAICTNTNAKQCECTTGTVACNQSFSQCKPDVQCPNVDRKGFGGTCQKGVGVCQVPGTVFCTANGFKCGQQTGISAKVLGQAGLRSGMDDATWRSVSMNSANFSQTPVVLSTPQTTNGGQDPSEAHVTNVSTGSFAIQHCELDVSSGGSSWCDTHAAETLGWAALDASKVNALSGIRAGTLASTSGTEPHDTFNYGTTFTNRPLLFATAQTNKGSDVPRNTQFASVGKSSATVEFCEQQSVDGCSSHTSETIGWLAVDPKNANITGVEMGEFMTSDSGWKRISFDSAFPKTPAVIADVQTDNGSSEALYPEVTNVTTTGADIRFCESDGANSCDDHTSERIAWIAFVPGQIKKQNNSNFTPIQPPPPPVSEEKACDGKDNDCDGEVDEGTTEVCDGIDNDCDGNVDENTNMSCPDSGKPGRCKAGTRTCQPNGMLSSCGANRRPVPEICNGLDDDCDGKIDNIRESWEKGWPNVDLSDLTQKQQDRACGKVGACKCGPNRSGADTKHRAPANNQSVSIDDEFDYMVKNTQTTCFCAE